MTRVHSLHRKRPHLLPPLKNSKQSALLSVGPLQPPDILLTKNRIGSPIPKRKDPKEFDDVSNEIRDKPIIRIEEINKNDGIGYNLMKLDLLSSSTLYKDDNLLNQVQRENTFTMPDLESESHERKNLFRSISTKQPEQSLGDMEKSIKFRTISPIEKLDTTKTCFQILNRYKLLRPIGERKTEV